MDKQTGPKGFLVVLPGEIIEMPPHQDGGADEPQDDAPTETPSDEPKDEPSGEESK